MMKVRKCIELKEEAYREEAAKEEEEEDDEDGEDDEEVKGKRKWKIMITGKWEKEK